MSKNDGGPAFPRTVRHFNDHMEGLDGMSLRDYFAIHCDQPGEAEIAVAAGLGRSEDGYFLMDGDEKITFAKWWGKTSQEERFRLYAKVRYGIADAMLAEREKAK